MNRFKNMHKTQYRHTQHIGRRPTNHAVDYRLRTKDAHALADVLQAVLYVPTPKTKTKPTTVPTSYMKTR